MICSSIRNPPPVDAFPPAAWAAVSIGLGETDRAFDWLGGAVEERSSLLVWLKVDPAFDPIRGDPRFEKLLDAAGLD